MNEVRLIDANAVKQDLELSKYIVPNNLNRLLNSEINRCIEAIDNAPTVNAIPNEEDIKVISDILRTIIYPEENKGE